MSNIMGPIVKSIITKIFDDTRNYLMKNQKEKKKTTSTYDTALSVVGTEK